MSLRLEFCWEVIQRVFMTLYIKYSKEVTHRFVEWINGRRITAVNFPSKYVLNLMPIIPMLFIISKILTSNKMLLHWNIDFYRLPNTYEYQIPVLYRRMVKLRIYIRVHSQRIYGYIPSYRWKRGTVSLIRLYCQYRQGTLVHGMWCVKRDPAMRKQIIPF